MAKNKEGEVSFNTDAHISLIIESLLRYGKKSIDIMAIIGDNCAVIKCLASRLCVPLIGCRSHILNLAVKKYLAPFKTELNMIQTIMTKLTELKNYALLQQLVPLDPVQQNDTRWSSIYNMLCQVFALARLCVLLLLAH
jgi:hypothetical protein